MHVPRAHARTTAARRERCRACRAVGGKRDCSAACQTRGQRPAGAAVRQALRGQGPASAGPGVAAHQLSARRRRDAGDDGAAARFRSMSQGLVGSRYRRVPLCATLDVTPFVGKRVPERQPRLPDLTTPLPYPYGYSRKRNTPMFRRLPSDEEAATYESPFFLAECSGGGSSERALPAPIDASPLCVRRVPRRRRRPRSPQYRTLASLMGDQSSVLMRRMERGFYVSLDREMDKGSHSYWRTQSNGFIPANEALSLVRAATFTASRCAKQHATPRRSRFVMSKDFFAYAPGAARARSCRSKSPATTSSSRSAADNGLERASATRSHPTGSSIYAAPRPRGSKCARSRPRCSPTRNGSMSTSARSRWSRMSAADPCNCDLDLEWSDQGRARSAQELRDAGRRVSRPGFEASRSATMDGDPRASTGRTSIEDVPYVMYFQLAYALALGLLAQQLRAPAQPRLHQPRRRSDAEVAIRVRGAAAAQGLAGVYPKRPAPSARACTSTAQTPEGLGRSVLLRSVVILVAEVGDQALALHPTQHVLELHALDEQIVFRIEARRGHRALVEKLEPFLDARRRRAARGP